MGIFRKPLSLSEKSKKITKLSPRSSNHDPFLMAIRQARGATMGGGDWRNHLLRGSRQRIVNKIMDILKRHLPFSGQEGLNELRKIATRFEEKIYTVATSQSDYLRKISLKLLSMESKSQNAMPNSLSIGAGNSRNAANAGTGMQHQVHNQMNLQMQSMNLQGPVATMPQSKMTSLQQNSMPSSSGVSTSNSTASSDE